MISDTISITYKRCKIEVQSDMITMYKVYDIDSGDLIMEGCISADLRRTVNLLKERITEYRAKQ